MKLIMENWRNYRIEHTEDDILFETFIKLEGNPKLNESTFRNLVAGLGIGAAAMFWTAMNQKASDIATATAEYRERKLDLETDQTKHKELEGLIMNGTAWQWNDDPSAGLGFPSIELDGEWHTIMPDSWSIAAKVAADKKAGIVAIPGLTPGALPDTEELYKSLKDPEMGSPDLTNFRAQTSEYLTPTSEHGTELRGIAKQLSPPSGPDLDVYQMSTMAVDPEYFNANPEHITVSGKTAKDLYIWYYFGKYLRLPSLE